MVFDVNFWLFSLFLLIFATNLEQFKIDYFFRIISKSREKLRVDILGPYFTPRFRRKSYQFFIPIIHILKVDILKLLNI